MATCEKTTERVPVTTFVDESHYTLKLNERETEMLIALCGKVNGRGANEDLAFDRVYYALKNAGVNEKKYIPRWDGISECIVIERS